MCVCVCVCVCIWSSCDGIEIVLDPVLYDPIASKC